jgi:hypothetical protein
MKIKGERGTLEGGKFSGFLTERSLPKNHSQFQGKINNDRLFNVPPENLGNIFPLFEPVFFSRRAEKGNLESAIYSNPLAGETFPRKRIKNLSYG